MFKKITAALLCCMIIIPSLVYAEDGPACPPAGCMEISSAEDMELLRTAPNASFILTDNIDMSGIDWEPAAFSGTLDGAGFAIFNLNVKRTGAARADTIDGNDKVYDSVFAGLFSTLTNAHVENLTILGADISIESSEHCFAGGLAGYIKNTVIKNCALKDVRVSLKSTCQPEPENPRTSCNAGVGGIAGFGSGTIENTSADTVLVFDDQTSSSLKVEEFMGGAVSCGNVTLKNCEITIDGYDACRGYAHNGGLVGMYYRYDKSEETGSITGCTVKGKISFFEDNRDRRAYCEPYVGEYMTWPSFSGCHQSFKSDETFNYKAVMKPEKCENPSFSAEVVKADCENWGYTQHSCATCGNTWKDSYTAPFHIPGEWTVVKEPEVGAEGLKQRICTVCGKTADEEIIPAIVLSESISLSDSSIELNYKDSITITALISPENATNKSVIWKSSDTDIATVDDNGLIYAAGRGETTVTCTSEDGNALAECTVKVKYSAKQWLIKTILFGWIWY